MWRLPKGSDFAVALAKGHLASTGVSYDDMHRPIIAIVNSWNDIVPGHVPLKQVSSWVRDGVLMAGGLPLEFNTIALCDGIAQGNAGMRYSLPSRELIADSIEIMVSGHGIFDGIVFVTACDKITPAMLMAAMRLDLPCIFVTGGPMNHMETNSCRKRIREAYLAGEVDERDLVTGGLGFYSGPGVCPFFGTANTMLVAAEALGLALPNSSTIPFGLAERVYSCRDAGKRVVELVTNGVRPSRIATREAYINAIRVLVALGGSLNALLHLPAIAAEHGVDVDWVDFDELSRTTPLLAALVPSGPHSAVDLHRAGGVPAVLNQLSPVLSEGALTVAGLTIGQIAESAPVKNPEVIHAFADPVHSQGGIAVLTGSLAPDGALIKTAALTDEDYVFSGPAAVFDDEAECTQAILGGRVADGSAIVIRYQGPVGGPGMPELHLITEVAARVKDSVVITDGRYSGATGGPAIGYVSPEAQGGGAIAIVKDGDIIDVDVPNRRLDLCVHREDLQARRSAWSAPEKTDVSGFLGTYASSIGSARTGARRIFGKQCD